MLRDDSASSPFPSSTVHIENVAAQLREQTSTDFGLGHPILLVCQIRQAVMSGDMDGLLPYVHAMIKRRDAVSICFVFVGWSVSTRAQANPIFSRRSADADTHELATNGFRNLCERPV